MPHLKHPGAPVSALPPEDLWLCVAGPWDVRANVPPDKPLWHARCSTERLRGLWLLHESVIRAAAGQGQPWIEQRLQFVDDLTERRGR